MDFTKLFSGGGGGGGGKTTSSAAEARAGESISTIGVSGQDLVWIAAVFAGALALVAVLWLALRK